jgi:hypothetical protein
VTDFTNIQGALRSRLAYVKNAGAIGPSTYATTYTERDVNMIGVALDYIERLEREAFALQTSNNTIAAQRDLEIRCRLDNAHLLTEADEKIAALRAALDAEVAMRNDLRAERNKLKEAYENAVGAPGAVHGPVFEQVKAQIINAVYDVLKANGINPTTPKPRPRFVVQTVNGYGPSRRPTTWYKIVDTTKPMAYGFERVAVAYTAKDARDVADFFNLKA